MATSAAYANSTFLSLIGGTLTGPLSGTSIQGSAVAATGSLTIGGGTAITQYISVTKTVTLPQINGGQCTTLQTAAVEGFSPGTSDTIALGIPGALMMVAASPAKAHGPPPPMVLMTYQAWETSATGSPTITLAVCNQGGSSYSGGDTGTVRIDIFKH